MTTKEQYARDKEKIMVAGIKYRRKNREAINARKRAYYQTEEGKEARRRYNKSWRTKNKEHVAAYASKYNKKWRREKQEMLSNLTTRELMERAGFYETT